jgi:hypothetical protein
MPLDTNELTPEAKGWGSLIVANTGTGERFPIV